MTTFPGTTALRIAGEPMGFLIPAVRDGIVRAFQGHDQLARMLTLTHGNSGKSSADQLHVMANNLDELHVTANNTDALQAGFTLLADLLRADGLITGWRNECFSVCKPDGTVWFALERAAFRPLGLISRAVHTHAWCSNGDTWLGRRAAHKATDPGRLDNLAAGGLSHGESPDDCMVRELWEEAGVPAALARRIQRLPEDILSQRIEAEGVHREWLYCYTLNVPDGFVPANRDGEVSGFTRHTTEELQTCMASAAMTEDAALCASLALRLRRAL